MKVLLAGYNIDAEVIAELSQNQNRQDITPETLSASYARISRDPRPINELRRLARTEVEKARRSNSNIIFKMGHHSVAEHAVFNFDLLDVSRLALEEIEKFRLCSYTEKSQRYQKLEGNFLIPAEIRGTSKEEPFVKLINKQNQVYQQLLDAGLEAEDARYVTSLSTYGQVGLTINARNLELLFRRFASAQLAEVRELGQKIFALVRPIAPSIILFTEANAFDRDTYPALRKIFRGRWERKRRTGKGCELVDYTAKADLKLVATLLHSSSGISFRNCWRRVKGLSQKERAAVVKEACRRLEFYDALLREFEHLNLTYDIVTSAACFAQLKRHRLATLTGQQYDPALGVTIPAKIKQNSLRGAFQEIIKETDQLFSQWLPALPVAAQYLLTGAHRKRLLMSLNVRELYHLSRLREDQHAQWEIQELTSSMTAAAKKVMPQALILIGGKDQFPEQYKKIFGQLPKVLPPKE